MWYLKVLSSLLIPVALICTIQDAHTLDTNAIKEEWTDLAKSAVLSDLVLISKKCEQFINNFNEGLNKSKTSADTKLSEPNNTTEDIVNLAADVKKQVTYTSNDLVSIRKLIQQVALRFRDTFKSVKSLTDLQCESVSKELEAIKKTEVNKTKPLVNRVIKSFGNRYDVNKLANKVLEESLDGTKLNDNYDEKKKQAMKELSSLYITLDNHAQSINDDALDTLKTLYEGMHAVKSVRNKVKNLGENALDKVKEGNDLKSLQNAVELTKALKLTFKDEWNLGSGELTYSEELQETATPNNKQGISNDNNPKNIIQADPEQKKTEPIVNNDKQDIIQPDIKEKQSVSTDTSINNNNVDYPTNELPLNSNTQNKDRPSSPVNLENNDSKNPNITKKTRGKKIMKPWDELINYNNSQISQESKKCKDLLQNTIPELENIKALTKNIIQSAKSDDDIKKTENDAVKQFYDKMIDTNTGLTNNLIAAADGDFANETPIDKLYETKFNDDPNIKRIKYLLGKNYDPNQYILKVLKDANQNPGKGGMKKTSYYKMLSVTHNLKNETRELDDTALYAMNKILEGKQAMSDLGKPASKEKFAKACYIYKILSQKENENERIDKTETKEKVKEILNENNSNEPIKPDVNLDYIDNLEPSTITDEEIPQVIINSNETTTSNELTTNDRPIQIKTEEKTNNINEKIISNNGSSKETQNNNKQNNDEPENLTSVQQKQEQMENINTINTKIPEQTSNSEPPTKTEKEKFSLNNPRNQNASGKSKLAQSVTIDERPRNSDDPKYVSGEYELIEETEEDLDDETEKNKTSNATNPHQNSDKNSVTPNDSSNPNVDDKTKGPQRKPEDNNNVPEKYNPTEETDKGLKEDPEHKKAEIENPKENLNKRSVIPNEGSNQNSNDKSKPAQLVTIDERPRNSDDPNYVSGEYELVEETEEEIDDETEKNKQSNITTPHQNSDKDSLTPHNGINQTADEKSKPVQLVTIDERPKNSDDPNYVSGEYELIEETEEDLDDETEKNKPSNTTNLHQNSDKDSVSPNDSSNPNIDDKTKGPPKIIRHRRHRNPKDPNNVSEEYNPTEETDKGLKEDPEHKKAEIEIPKENLNKSSFIPNEGGNQNSDDTSKPAQSVKIDERPRNSDDPNYLSGEYELIEETEEELDGETEKNKPSNTTNPHQNSDKDSVTPNDSRNPIFDDETKGPQKVTGRRKHLEPKDANDVSQKNNPTEENDEGLKEDPEHKQSEISKPTVNVNESSIVPNEDVTRNLNTKKEPIEQNMNKNSDNKNDDSNIKPEQKDVADKDHKNNSIQKKRRKKTNKSGDEYDVTYEEESYEEDTGELKSDEKHQNIKNRKLEPATAQEEPHVLDVSQNQNLNSHEKQNNEPMESTSEKEDSENIDSVEGKELNGVDHDEIQAKVDSYEEKSHSLESNQIQEPKTYQPSTSETRNHKDQIPKKPKSNNGTRESNEYIDSIESVEPIKVENNQISPKVESYEYNSFSVESDQSGTPGIEGKIVQPETTKQTNINNDKNDNPRSLNDPHIQNDINKNIDSPRQKRYGKVRRPRIKGDDYKDTDTEENEGIEDNSINDEENPDNSDGGNSDDGHTNGNLKSPRSQEDHSRNVQTDTSKQTNPDDDINENDSLVNGPHDEGINNNPQDSLRQKRYRKVRKPRFIGDNENDPNTDENEAPEHYTTSSEVGPDDLTTNGGNSNGDDQANSSKQIDAEDKTDDNNNLVNGPDEESGSNSPLDSPRQKRYKKIRKPKFIGDNDNDPNTDENEAPDHYTISSEVGPDDLTTNGGNSNGDDQANSSKQIDAEDNTDDQDNLINGPDEESGSNNPLDSPRQKRYRKVRKPRFIGDNDTDPNTDENEAPEHYTISSEIGPDDLTTNEGNSNGDDQANTSKQIDADGEINENDSLVNGPDEESGSNNPLNSPRQKRYRKVKKPRFEGDNDNDPKTDENEAPEHYTISSEVGPDDLTTNGGNSNGDDQANSSQQVGAEDKINDNDNLVNVPDEESGSNNPLDSQRQKRYRKVRKPRFIGDNDKDTKMDESEVPEHYTISSEVGPDDLTTNGGNSNGDDQANSSKQTDADGEINENDSLVNGPDEESGSNNPLNSPRQKRYRKVKKPRFEGDNDNDPKTDENEAPEHYTISSEVGPDDLTTNGGNSNGDDQANSSQQVGAEDKINDNDNLVNVPDEESGSNNPLDSPRQKRYRKVRKPRFIGDNDKDINLDESEVPEHYTISSEVGPDDLSRNGGNSNGDDEANSSKQTDIDDERNDNDSLVNGLNGESDSYDPTDSPRQKRYRKVKKPRFEGDNDNDPKTDENEAPEHYTISSEVGPDDLTTNGGNSNGDDQANSSQQVGAEDKINDNDSFENGFNGESGSYDPTDSPRQKRYRKVRKPRFVGDNDNDTNIDENEVPEHYTISSEKDPDGLSMNEGNSNEDDEAISSKQTDIDDERNDNDSLVNGLNGESGSNDSVDSPGQKRYRKNRKPKFVGDNDNDINMDENEVPEHYTISSEVDPDGLSMNEGHSNADDEAISSKQTDIDDERNDNDSLVNGLNGESGSNDSIDFPRQKRYRKVRKPRFVGDNDNDTNTDENEVPEHYTISSEVGPDDLSKNGGNSNSEDQAYSSKQTDADGEINENDSLVNRPDEESGSNNPLQSPRQKRYRKVRKPRFEGDNDDGINMDENEVPEHYTISSEVDPDGLSMNEGNSNEDYDVNSSKQTDIDDERNDNDSLVNGLNGESGSNDSIDSPRQKRYRKVRKPRFVGDNDNDTYTDENEVPEHYTISSEVGPDDLSKNGGNSNSDDQAYSSKQTDADGEINENDNLVNGSNGESGSYDSFGSPRQKRYRRVRKPRFEGDNDNGTNMDENEVPEHYTISSEVDPDGLSMNEGNSNEDYDVNSSRLPDADDEIKDNDSLVNGLNGESGSYDPTDSPRQKRYRKVRKPRFVGDNDNDTNTDENEVPEHYTISSEVDPDSLSMNGGNSNGDDQAYSSKQTDADGEINENDNLVNGSNGESGSYDPFGSPRQKRYRRVRKPRFEGDNDNGTNMDENEVPEHYTISSEVDPDGLSTNGGNSNGDDEAISSKQTDIDDERNDNDSFENGFNGESGSDGPLESPRQKRYRKVRKPRSEGDNDDGINMDENEVPEHNTISSEADPDGLSMNEGNPNEDYDADSSRLTDADDEVKDNDSLVNGPHVESGSYNPLGSPRQKRYRKVRRPRVLGNNDNDIDAVENEIPERYTISSEVDPDDSSMNRRNLIDGQTVNDLDSPGSHEYGNDDVNPGSLHQTDMDDHLNVIDSPDNGFDEQDDKFYPSESGRQKRYRKVRRPRNKPIEDKSDYVQPDHRGVIHGEGTDGVDKYRGNSDNNDIKEAPEVPETFHHVNELPYYSKRSELDGGPLENENYMNGATGPDNINYSTPRRGKRYRRVRRPRVIRENVNEPENSNNGNIVGGFSADKDVNIDNVPNKDDGTNYHNENGIDSNNNIVADQNDIPGDSNNEISDNNELANNSTEQIEGDNNKTHRPNTKKRIKRIRSYMVNKTTNEKIPINDKTYATVNGVREMVDNTQKLIDNDNLLDDSNPDSLETKKTDEADAFSSFLFNEYNADQCKRDAYDKFKKVSSQDSKQIAYGSILDTSELRSSILTAINDAIRHVKASKTKHGMNQSMKKVSDTLKTGLKNTINSFLHKIVPFGRDYLKTANNLKHLYQKGPQSTYKMLSNIIHSEPTIPDSAAKDILKIISPEFNVDDLVDNIFKNHYDQHKNLRKLKFATQRKLIDLSKNMDTAISNIDCSMLSAMSTVGLGMDTMNSLKSGRMIMSDKHPRAQALKDAVEIIKIGQNSEFDENYSPKLTSPLVSPDGDINSTENDGYDDPDRIAQKNEEFLKNVPHLDNNVPIPKKVQNKRQSLGIIVVHPDKHIEYKEVIDTTELNKFVGDQTKKYKLQPKSNYPKFLKVNSEKVIDTMVDDIKKKAQENGMTKKEMVDELITSLKNNN